MIKEKRGRERTVRKESELGKKNVERECRKVSNRDFG